jgi:hypothetical protein
MGIVFVLASEYVNMIIFGSSRYPFFRLLLPWIVGPKGVSMRSRVYFLWKDLEALFFSLHKVYA